MGVKERLVVVGGGLGGLSAAIHLAAAGRRVTIFEKNEAVGGKMGELRQAGFRWDTGPTVITLRHVLEDLFATANRRMQEYDLALVPVEPLTRYVYADGTVLDISANLAQTIAHIEALDRRDVGDYLRFLSYAAQMYRITAPVVIYDDPPTLRSVLQLPVRDIVQVDWARTMDAAIRSHVRSPYLRQLFDRFATYLGASPYRARAFLNVIAHVELTAGLWYPKGGTYAIARAYRRLAEELGVEIHTGARVTRILTDHDGGGDVGDDVVIGVELEEGTMERAAAVIADVDATTVYRELLPGMRQSRRLRRWMRAPFACSGFVMLLGVDRQHPQLAHHNIFFSSDYPAEFDAIFRRGVPPEEPTVYIAITSKSDPDHAPQGSENWFVMVNVPPMGPNWDWERQAQGYRDRVLDRLANLGLDVRGHIRTEHMLTPPELQRMTGAWRGALYGHSFNHPLASFKRPHNRSPDVRGLYFAGGTTHPGGGVPMVTLSGKTAARMVLQDSKG
jgi:phytoene desaturase